MNSGEIFGIGFFVLLVLGAFFGLRALSRKRISSEAEFERNAAQSSSVLGAGVKALQGMLDPGHEKAKQAVAEFERGIYDKRSESGEGPESGERVRTSAKESGR